MSYTPSDLWVGASKGSVNTSYKNVHDASVQPLLIEQKADEWIYSDSTPYNSSGDYRYRIEGTDPMAGPCVYLKLISSFDGKEQVCENDYAFWCEWKSK